jgi:predicted signal transduction protein with EAL and GGDEF domain
LKAPSAIALGPRDQGVAQGDHLGDLFGAVGTVLERVDEAFLEPGRVDVDLGQAALHVGIGIVDEEVRQLHDVAVGVVVGASLGVGHRSISLTVLSGVPQIQGRAAVRVKAGAD